MPTTSASSQPRRSMRHSQGGHAYTFQSSAQSSDDEGAQSASDTEVRVWPTHHRPVPCERLRYKVDPVRNLSCQHYTGVAPHTRSKLGRCRHLLSPSTPCRPEVHNEVFVTTMDEDDQQMFIALFFWRRKVIQAYFSAWKWVIFSLHRSGTQLHRHEREIRPSNVVPVDDEFFRLHRPRSNLLLKRCGGGELDKSRIVDSGGKPMEVHNQKSQANSSTNQIERLSAIQNKSNLLEGQSNEARRHFRANLRLVYVCFDQWKAHMDESRMMHEHQLAVATEFRCRHHLRAFFDVWTHSNSIRKHKIKRCHIADRYRGTCTKHKFFNTWKRHYCIERNINQRQKARDNRQMRSVFQHWCQYILKTHQCRAFAVKRCRYVLQVTFSTYRQGLHIAKEELLKRDAATSHSQKKLQAAFVRIWKQAVFESPFYLLTIVHGKQIGMRTGIRMWKRFVFERQQRAQKYLLTDFFRYQASLRRAVDGWRRFLLQKLQVKQVDDKAWGHYEHNLKAAALCKLRSAGYLNRACRSRIKMATQWHEQKLLTRLFGLWVVRIRHGVQLQQLHLAIHKRKLNDAICFWQSYTTLSKTLELKRYHVSKRLNELLLTVCMKKWTRMLHIKMFKSSLIVQRQHASFKHYFKVWHRWATRKISRRKAVEIHLHQHDTNLLQHIVCQWRGVTLRKKCFQRLVKLFRKKQNRQRAKSTFRRIQVYALCFQHSHRLNHVQRQCTFQKWKGFYRESKEKRMALASATQYFSFRRYVIAIKQWLSLTDRRALKRSAHSKALSHCFRQTLKGALHYWYVATRRRRRQKEFICYRQQLRDSWTTTNIIHAWYILARKQAHYRTQKWMAIAFQRKSIQSRSFRAWQNYLTSCKLAKGDDILASITYKNKVRTKCCQVWRREARKSAQHNSICLFMRSAVKQRQLRTSITRWCTYHRDHRRRRELHATAEKFHNEYLLCLVMTRWQETWFKTSVLRSKEVKASRHINDRRLAKTVSRWRTNHRYDLQIRARISKASTLYRTGLLSKNFHAWKRCRYLARYRAVIKRQAARQFDQNLLSRAFKAWRCFLEGKSIGRWKWNYAFEHRTAALRRLAFRRWKCHRSNYTLNRAAKMNYEKQLLQKAWVSWRSHCEFSTKVRKKILVTKQLLRHNLFRTTFVQWKVYVSERQNRCFALICAEDHHINWLCKQAVARWRERRQFQQTTAKALMLARVNGARNFLNRWKHFVVIARTKCSQYSLAMRTHLLKSQRRHVLAWKMHAKRCMHERKNKSDALYRATCLRMVWTRWRRVVGWKHCILTMNRRQIEYLRVDIWCRWRTYAEKCIEYKGKAESAMVFQRRKLRAKMWQSWLDYIANQHTKQQQLVWVLGYYSVEVLQRQSIASWKKLVVIQRARQEAVQLAEWFNARRIARDGYRRLKVYVKLRKQKLARAEALLFKAEAIVLSRSIYTWKRISSIWHQLHCYETLAAQTFINRRLKRGLEGLLAWRVSKRKTRAFVIQAERFRDENAVLAHFHCWRRYHQWRVKHAYLTQVFKRNQKGNIFARWKTYWQRCQVANERQLQARVLHCVHTEQHILDTWKVFLYLHKQKKKASAFYTARTLQRTCMHWKRRIHALQRIRKVLCYQQSLCTQMHFDAWKKYAIGRRKLDERVRGAMKFKDNLRKLDAWQKWCAWISSQRQQRETIVLAVRFQQRFFSRKIFVLWRDKARFWKRKRILGQSALLQCRVSRLCQAFRALADRRLCSWVIMERQSILRAQLIEKRKRRTISSFRQLCARRECKRQIIARACCHWKKSYQRKHWDCLLEWNAVVRKRKLQFAEAAAFARKHALKRCFAALSVHNIHVKQLQAKIYAFRCKYFRSMADNCFYQWKSFATFKLKLRALRRKARRTQRRQRFLQWRFITAKQARQREGVASITAKRHHRELMSRFNHWESVCTDLWIENQLACHHQRHAQKQRRLRSAARKWKLQLARRQQRQRCRQFVLERNRVWLVHVLQQWRWAADPLQHVTCDHSAAF